MIAVWAVGCSSPRPVDAIRDAGDFKYDRRDYAAAASEYSEITDRYPGDWRAQYRLGLCNLELNKPVEAGRALEIALTLSPNNPKIADALAQALYLQGEETRLFAFLKERADAQQTTEAYLRLASYAEDMDDHDLARVAYDTAISLDDGQTVDPYLRASAFAQELGDLDEAVRRLRQAYSIDPYDERINTRLRELGEVPGPTLALPPTDQPGS